MIKIIEQFTHGKIADNSYSEDRLVIGSNCAAVIDGAIGPGYMQKDMITTALDRVVDTLETLAADAGAIETFAEISTILAETKAQHGIDELRYTGGFHIAL